MSFLSVTLFNFDKHLDTEQERKNIYYIMTLILFSSTGMILLFLSIITFFQIKFITSNMTTSEYIRKETETKNVFDNGCKENLNQFRYNILGYNNEISLNEDAKNNIMSSSLITSYFDFVEIVQRKEEAKKSISSGVSCLDISSSSIKTDTELNLETNSNTNGKKDSIKSEI